MKKSVKILLTVAFLLLISIFLFSAYKLYDIFHEYKVAGDAYDSMSSQYVKDNMTADPVATTTVSEDGTVTDTLLERSPITVDFNLLLEECKDIIGWIYSEDTVINYPMVQTTDNSTYLHHLTNGKYNDCGTIFVDYRNAPEFADRNTIIYGHHMNNGAMFASLCEYKNQDYYERHPSLYISTPKQNYRVDVFSAFVTSSDSSAYTIQFDSDDAFEAFCAKMKAFSDCETDVTVKGTDHIVVFSTCTYEYDDARFVVFGKLVPIA